MKIPGRLDILGVQYKVSLLDEIPEEDERMVRMGRAIPSEQLIEIRDGGTAAARGQVLLHEIMHILYLELIPSEHHEDTVSAISAGLYAVIKANRLRF